MTASGEEAGTGFLSNPAHLKGFVQYQSMPTCRLVL